jgi:hypothetical protein
MAKYDVTTVITANMAQGDSTDRQPGGGVEEQVLDICDVDTDGSIPSKVGDLSLYRIDGTNNDSFLEQGDGGNMARVWFRCKHLINNTNYARITHQGATTGDYSFSIVAVG